MNVHCAAASSRHVRLGWLWLMGVLVSLFAAGCATSRATFKVHPEATSRVARAGQVAVVPVDAELSELTAGGILEPRMEWTATARRNLIAALAAETGFTPAELASAPLEASAELEAVQALLRALTVHRMSSAISGRNDPFAENNQTLSYHTGELQHLAAAIGTEAVLFVFIRDSFASAGRKSLIALSVVGAALTGVAIVPQMGSTSMSAALVARDGTVLWFNHSLGGHDPRTPEGARALVRDLLKGLPARTRAE